MAKCISFELFFLYVTASESESENERMGSRGRKEEKMTFGLFVAARTIVVKFKL